MERISATGLGHSVNGRINLGVEWERDDVDAHILPPNVAELTEVAEELLFKNRLRLFQRGYPATVSVW